MPSPLRHIARAADREPKPLRDLSRAQIAGRVYALRTAMDMLASQGDLDGGAVAECTGAMRKCLIGIEERLREFDRQAPTKTLVDAVNSPEAVARITALATQLAEARGISPQEVR